MLHTKTTLLSLSFFVSILSYSQSGFPGFGAFDAEEIKLKKCSFDPEADAIILLDKAVADYDDQYRLVTERRIRIKILNEKAVDRANIIIPFYSGDIEFLSKIEAYTFNFDESGNPSVLIVDKKSIHTEKTTKNFSLIKFAMP